MMVEQKVVNNRNREKDRRPRSRERVRDNLRRWFFATENRGRTVQQRKREAVAQTVSERQSRRRKQAIVFRDAQHFATERLVRVEDVGLTMDRALRLTGAP
jgi:hypothetical protein